MSSRVRLQVIRLTAYSRRPPLAVLALPSANSHNAAGFESLSRHEAVHVSLPKDIIVILTLTINYSLFTISCPLDHLAGEQGFEPQLAEPESAVLPLDDSPALG